DQGAEGAAGHHDAEDARAIGDRERFGDQGNSNNNLAAGAKPAEEAKDAQLQWGMRETLQRREYAVGENADGEGAYPADVVGDDSEQEAAERPAQQADHAQDAADAADIGQRRVAAEQLGQSRTKDERVEAEVGCVERPAGPDDKENQPLIARQA